MIDNGTTALVAKPCSLNPNRLLSEQNHIIVYTSINMLSLKNQQHINESETDLKGLESKGDRVALRHHDLPHTLLVSLVVVRVVGTGQVALVLHNLTPTISPPHTTTTGKYRFTGGPDLSQSHPRTPLQQVNTGLQVALVLHNLTPAHHYNR